MSGSVLGRELRIHFHILRRKLMLLLIMALIILFLGAGVAIASSAQGEEGQFMPISLAVVVDSDDAAAQAILKQVMRSESMFPKVTLELAASEAAAQEMVKNGEVAGALILPSDFYAWMNGDDESNPLLLINSLSGIERAVFSTIGNGMLSMLSDAQRGIDLGCQAYEIASPKHVSYDTVWMGLNIHYFSTAFDQSDRFSEQLVSGPESFSTASHYILCICICFCMLTTPLFYDQLSMERNALWLRRLRGVGVSSVRYGCYQILVTWAGYCVMLSVLTAGIAAVLNGMGESLQLSGFALLPIVLGGLLLAMLAFCLANVGGLILGALISCLLASFSLISAGGLIARVLLPEALQQLGVLSPVLWLRNLFGRGLLGLDGHIQWALLGLFCGILLLGAVNYFLCCLFQRRRLL